MNRGRRDQAVLMALVAHIDNVIDGVNLRTRPARVVAERYLVGVSFASAVCALTEACLASILAAGLPAPACPSWGCERQ